VRSEEFCGRGRRALARATPFLLSSFLCFSPFLVCLSVLRRHQRRNDGSRGWSGRFTQTSGGVKEEQAWCWCACVPRPRPARRRPPPLSRLLLLLLLAAPAAARPSPGRFFGVVVGLFRARRQQRDDADVRRDRELQERAPHCCAEEVKDERPFLSSRARSLSDWSPAL